MYGYNKGTKACIAVVVAAAVWGGAITSACYQAIHMRQIPWQPADLLVICIARQFASKISAATGTNATNSFMPGIAHSSADQYAKIMN